MKFRVLAAFVVAALAAVPATQAATIHFEGFEDPSWTAGSDPGNWQNFGGSIVRSPSGTNGITSSDGVAHALVTGGTSGPFTRFGGYRTAFGQGFQILQDVYLDSSWVDNTGFEFSVAANSQANTHVRDFIWHVGKVGGDFYVNASNNTNFSFDAGKLLNGDQFAVSGAGWYTLENVFYDNGGALAVDFNLYDGVGLVTSFTLSNPADLISTVVGGNRYGWFTFANVSGGLAVDNTTLNAVPEPGSLILLGLGAVSALGLRRRRQNKLAA